MPGKFFLLFVALPLVDLYLLILLGRSLGAGPVVLLVIATALFGISLAKWEGFRVLRSWQRELSQGRVPEEGVLTGVLLLLGALLLILPGPITDAAGLILLFRPTRRLVAGLMKRSVARQIRTGTVHVITRRIHVGPPPGYGPFDPRSPRDSGGEDSGSGRIIDVEGGTIDERRVDGVNGVDRVDSGGADRAHGGRSVRGDVPDFRDHDDGDGAGDDDTGGGPPR